MSTPQLRGLADRIRQVALFEIIGVLIISPLFALASGAPMLESAALLAVLSLIAALWNGVYCTGFDWLEGRLTGRPADQRPQTLRILHAVGFEGGLMILTLPVIVWWTGMGFWNALLADLALALTYAGYAYVFNLAYDRLFPIAPRP